MIMKKISLVAIILLCLANTASAGPHVSSVNAGEATTAASGIVELATDAEAIAGTDAVRALTPANLRAVILDDMADAILSGTPVILGIKDKDGNIYYFKAYPTKTAY